MKDLQETPIARGRDENDYLQFGNIHKFSVVSDFFSVDIGLIPNLKIKNLY